MRIRKTIAITASCLSLIGIAGSTVLPVAASEGRTKAEQLQEALLKGDAEPDATGTDPVFDYTEDNEEDTASGKTDLEIAWENLTAGQIVTGIKQLDEDSPDAKKVRALRKSYNKLPAAEKVKVSNIDSLTVAEELLAAQEESAAQDADTGAGTGNTAAATEKTNVEGTDYTFVMGEIPSSLTLIIRYTTDDNHDGRGDTPSVSITSPDNTVTTMTNKMTGIRDDTTFMSFTWEQNYLQVDVAYARVGSWTISTDIPVTFTKKAYMGDRNLLVPANTEKKNESDASSVTPSGEGTGAAVAVSPLRQYIPLIRLAGLGAAVAAAFVAFWIASKKFFGTGGKDATGKGSVEKEKVNYGGRQEPLSEEEEIEQIKRELAEQHRMEEEAAARSQALAAQEEEKEKGQEDDPRLYQTMEDLQESISGDQSIEEFEESAGDTGILSGGKPAQPQDRPAPAKRPGRFSGRFS